MLLGLINAAGYLGGSRAAVLATAAVLIMATVTRLVAQYRRRRSARQARADVAHACTALASYLRVGQVPSAALPIAAADCDVLREDQQAHTPSAGTWQLYGASRHSVSGTEAFLSWRVLADLDGARFATSRCRGSRRATERAAGAGSGGRHTDDQILIYMERSGNCRSILFATQRSPFLGRFAAQRVIGQQRRNTWPTRVTSDRLPILS